MKDLGKALAGVLVIGLMIQHVNMQEIDVHCIFEPPLENGRLTIPINSYQVFVCEHIHRGQVRINWSMMNITRFESEVPDIGYVKQDNATCLRDYNTLCDRITIIFTPTSTEHKNKLSKICTLFGTPPITHCSKEFTVEIRQGTPSEPTTIVPSLTQTTSEQIQTQTTSEQIQAAPITKSQSVCSTIIQLPLAVTDEIHDIRDKVDQSGIQQYLNTIASIFSIILLPAILIIGLRIMCSNTKQRPSQQKCRITQNRISLEQYMYGSDNFEEIHATPHEHPEPPPITEPLDITKP